MKHIAQLFVFALFSCLLPVPATAADGLKEIAASKRAAAIELGVMLKGGRVEGRGVFITADGLALVDLSMIALPQRPVVFAEDGREVAFGTILGIFPEQELALMKFDYSPKVWLPIAPQEPKMGEPLAFIALKAFDFLATDIPPVVGPIIAKRSSLTVNLSKQQFTRVLSLGSGLTFKQQPCIGPGSFAINNQGELVAIKQGIEMMGRQMLLLLTPITALGEEISRLARGGKSIPHPLPAATNPVDTGLMDEEYSHYEMAQRMGDSAAAMVHLEELAKRYPNSTRIQDMASHLLKRPTASNPAAKTADAATTASQISAVEKVVHSVARARDLADANKDYTGAVKVLTQALDVCPKDYPVPLINLAEYEQKLGHSAEYGRHLRDALAVAPEIIWLVEQLQKWEFEQKHYDEAQKLTDRIYELERLYRRR